MPEDELELWEIYPDDDFAEDMVHRGRIEFLELCYVMDSYVTEEQ